MLTSLLPLRETHLIGPRCREWVMLPERIPQLRHGRFMWVGHGELLPPYRIVRLRSVYTHVVACSGGEGRVVIDGRVVPWRPGQVLLAPSGTDHGFEIVEHPREPWRIAWVFWNDLQGERLIDAPRARLIEADVEPFVRSVELAAREALGEAEPAAMQAWVSLLQTHTRRLVGGTRQDERLRRLWQRVESELTAPWTVTAMAAAAAVSEEHLRRLCHQFYRRSPISYLTQLRMHRAGVLLRASNVTVETVAEQVGFGSVHAFSTAFKRWSGVPPTVFRRRDRDPDTNNADP